MRAGAAGNPIIDPVGEPKKVTRAQSVMSEAIEDKESNKSALSFWIGFGVLYFLWDFFVLRNSKLKETIDPANIRANLYNLTFIGIAAVLFINGGKVLLVKLAALEWPGVSPLAKKLLPLFQL